MSLEQSRLYSFVDDKNNGIPITASRMDAELNQDISALNQKVIIKAVAPSSPIAGMFWYDSTNKLLKEYRNSEWIIHGPVHISSAASSTTQAGDIWIDSSGSEQVFKIRNKANSAWLTLLQTSDIIATIMPLIYPVGSVYGNRTVSTNPATLLGFGTWVAIGGFIAGIDGSTEFLTAGQTGGAKTVNLAHTHTGKTGTEQNIGAGSHIAVGAADKQHDHSISSDLSAAQSILPPYTAIYLWYRST